MFSQMGSNVFSQVDGGQGANGSPAKRRQEEKQTVLPATVRMVELAAAEQGLGDEELRLHGEEAGLVILVGAVESLTKGAANVDMVLNDSTGRMKVRWFSQEASQDSFAALEAGRYVSMVGNVRTKPALHFSVSFLHLLDSADWVSHHMIEVAYVSLKSKQMAVQATPTPAQKPQLASDAVTPVKQTADSLTAPTLPMMPQAVAAAVPVKGPLEDLAVLAYMQRDGAGRLDGLAFADITKNFNLWREEEVRAALDRMLEAGDIFNTLDENHFNVL